MIYPYYFTYRVIQVGFFNTLGSHHINHSFSEKTIKQTLLNLQLNSSIQIKF